MRPLLNDKNHYNFVLDNLFIALATFFWLSYVPIAINSVVQILKNRKVFVEQDLRRIHNDPAIIFQITTRSATKTPVVKRGILSILNSAHKVNFYNYQISVITDDANDVKTLEKEKCEVVTVDKDFRTNAIKKGRALQYAVEHRRRIGSNTEKHWVFHMDDESYVTTQTILALLKFIREGKGVASEGPIFYPLKFESANRITAIAESIRPFACYDCVSQMTNPPPLHMHGSNLLVRSDVEDDIGWNFGPTLAEDQMFGFKVYEKYGRGSMGWHGGILLEQPPLNVKDHFFQRRRWVLGTMQNLQKFPRWHRYKLIFKSITYFLGFASALASFALMLHNYVPLAFSLPNLNYNMVSLPSRLPEFSLESIVQSIVAVGPVEIGVGALLLFTSLVWLSSYQLGLFLNLRYSKIGWPKRLLFHAQTLLMSPLIGLVETFPAFWATIEYLVKKQQTAEKMPVYDFYVISK
jgi:cellulose synthase/poly-beta-1,6-N-acetylglucosamine synthase-like glycosyltransferase